MAEMNPSVVIGLGGTGQRAVLRLKQRLVADARYTLLDSNKGVETFGTEESTWIKNQGIAMFGLDGGAPDQPTVGEGMGLTRPAENPIISSKQAQKPFEHLQNVGDDAANAGLLDLRDWLTHEDVKDLTIQWGALSGDKGFGQMRWFGRLVVMVEKVFFADQIKNAIQTAKQAAGGRQVDVYIVCSVAGGTGGGLFIDAAARVNEEFKRARNKANVIGMLVLPDAFSGIAAVDHDMAEANGFALLRELNRLMCRPKGARVGGIALDYQVLDTCYLIAGNRDAGDALMGDASQFDFGLPVALGDAMYAMVFPSTGSRVKLITTNLPQYLISPEKDERFATFGIHSVIYDWDPTLRSLALRYGSELLEQLLLEERWENLRAYVSGFLALGKLQAQSVTAEAGEGLCQLVSQGLAGQQLPKKVEAAYLAPFSRVRTDGARTRLDLLGEVTVDRTLSEKKTSWQNADLAEFIDGGPGAGAGSVPAFLGKEDDTFDPAKKTNSVSAYLSLYERESLDEWKQHLADSVAFLLNEQRRVAGPSRALRFLEGLRGEIVSFTQTVALRLGDENEPARLLNDVLKRKACAEEACKQVRTKGPIGIRQSDDAKLQMEYVDLAQSYVDLSIEQMCLTKALRMLGLMKATVENIEQTVASWRATLRRLKDEAEARRVAIDDARTTESRSPMRTLVPFPGGACETHLYARETGREVELVGGELRLKDQVCEKLLARLDSLSWTLDDSLDQQRLRLGGPWSEGHIELADVHNLGLDDLSGLRKRSVFDVLELGLRDEEINGEAEKLATRFHTGATPMATLSKVGLQRDDEQHTTEQKQIVFAAASWVADGPGRRMSEQLQIHLGNHQVTTCPIEEVVEGDPQAIKAAGTTNASYPTSDKLLVFRGEYLIRLPGFQVVADCEESYQKHKAPLDEPSIHILPEEKHAARFEYRCGELQEQGLLDFALPPLSPEGIMACSKPSQLLDCAWCAADGRLASQVQQDTGQRRWVLLPIGPASEDSRGVALADDDGLSLTLVLSRLVRPGDRDNLSKRAVKGISEAAKVIRTERRVGERATIEGFVRNYVGAGWDLSDVDDALYRESDLLMRVALADWFGRTYGAYSS